MKQLSELSVVELKAMAYDQMAFIEKAQANFKAINEQLVIKLKQESEKALEKKK